MMSQTIEMLQHWRVGDEMDITRESRELTLRIIVKALFDLDLAEEGSRLSRTFATVVDAQPFGFCALLPPAVTNLPFMPGRAMPCVRRLIWTPSSTV